MCPWSLALSIPVLGLESVCPRKSCPWPRIFFVSLALASSLVSSTPPLLYSEQKPSVKKRSTGPVKNRSTGVDFEIYRSGRVEKILTGSISVSHIVPFRYASVIS